MSNPVKTIGEEFGPAFERLLSWCVIFDKKIGERLLPNLPDESFSSVQGQTILERGREILARGIYPTYSVLYAELQQQRNRTAEKSTIREEVEATLSFMRKLAKRKAPSNEERGYLIERMGDYVVHRALFNAFNEGAELWSQGNYGKIVGIMEDAAKSRFKVEKPDVGVDVFGSYKQKLKRYTARRDVGRQYPMGVTLMDTYIRNGGIIPGNLGIFYAPAHRGKTMALVNTGYHALRAGAVVAHVTLEIDALEVEARYDARASNNPINSFFPEVMDADWARRIKKAQRRAAKTQGARLFIKEWGSNEVSCADLSAYLDVVRTEAGRPVDGLLVDYIDLLNPVGRFTADNTRFALAEITRGLRNLAKQHDCVVWTASQTGRNSFSSKELKMSDVAECIEKSNIADVIIGLCQSDIEKKKKRIRLSLLKNRLGGHDGEVVECIYDAKIQKIAQSLLAGTTSSVIP